MSDEAPQRRPLKTRGTQWAAACARKLAAWGFTPNQISVASVFFAAGSFACLRQSGCVPPDRAGAWLIGAAALIQLRLLCNMFDGMIAIEGGMKSRTGEIYNELPDRFADAFTLVGAGYAIQGAPWQVEMGWAAALSAILIAYIRALGASAGAKHYFQGPMAKAHRMALMTFAALFQAFVLFADSNGPLFMHWALAALAVGGTITAFRRVRRIMAELNSK